MRSIFLLGGFVGFCVVLAGGWIAGRPMPSVLRDAAIGCLLMAFLFRWFWSVVIRSFRDTARLRRETAYRAEMAAAAAEEAAGADRPR